ncbi:MAG: hypothetical protein Pg6A_05510 [Termitinemataceae bacterium]|nr:MAG: hypothetical protein Pg6A_05510 [Termitinemataceae bacterium]
MKNKNGVISALLIGLCTAVLPALSEADFQTQANDDGSVTIIKYSGWDKDIAIPGKIGGKAVTAIGEDAFKSADLTSVTIPDSVKIIEESAFEDNKLVKVTIGKGVTTIKGGAFANNKLTSVIIPDGVDISGSYQSRSSGGAHVYGFYKNPLSKVTLGTDCFFSKETFGRFAFFSYWCNGRKAGTYTVDETFDKNWEAAWYKTNRPGKQSTDGYSYAETPYGMAIVNYYGSSKRLEIPDKLDNKPVKYIEGLDKKGLTGVRIPDSVVAIWNDAFSNNNLTSGVTLGNGVNYIGKRAFENSKLTSVTIGNSVKYIGLSAFYKNQLTSVVIPDSVKEIEEGAFKENKLTSVTLGKGVTTIGKSAFGNNELTSVTIPDSVNTIGASAFESNKLTSVTLGKGFTTIGKSAFYHNDLTSVTIPDSVKEIEADAFRSNKLTSVTLGKGVTTIGQNAFYDDDLTSVTIPANVSLADYKNGDLDKIIENYESNGKKAVTYLKYKSEWRTEAEIAEAKAEAEAEAKAKADKEKAEAVKTKANAAKQKANAVKNLFGR